jgi:hypothetical protein
MVNQASGCLPNRSLGFLIAVAHHVAGNRRASVVGSHMHDVLVLRLLTRDSRPSGDVRQ